MKNHKAKGTKGERDLVKAFNEAGWGCIRIAGSGSSHYPSPDILAGNAVRRLAIECKVTKEAKKYFTNQEIEQLNTFSQHFGAESWVGIKFPNDPWYFLMLEDLKNTGKSWFASLEVAKRKGLTIEELLQMSNKNRNI
ncbi:Holliday junction resolvase [Candidatus Woesearchaeota archaeon CG10_big_fil_rev_8_21_14_0_10_36_11]|nr:MAG: Holliday junction resolvase [Candidatus Woesearchaeota archaeon CG10_big_fil_rev_8_21_14_0_10_36_11]